MEQGLGDHYQSKRATRDRVIRPRPAGNRRLDTLWLQLMSGRSRLGSAGNRRLDTLPLPQALLSAGLGQLLALKKGATESEVARREPVLGREKPPS